MPYFFFASFSFSLKKAIGWPSWLNTHPIATAEASYSMENNFSKSNRDRIEASITSFLRCSKMILDTLVHEKDFPLVQLVKGALTPLKFMIIFFIFILCHIVRFVVARLHWLLCHIDFGQKWNSMVEIISHWHIHLSWHISNLYVLLSIFCTTTFFNLGFKFVLSLVDFGWL